MSKVIERLEGEILQGNSKEPNSTSCCSAFFSSLNIALYRKRKTIISILNVISTKIAKYKSGLKLYKHR